MNSVPLIEASIYNQPLLTTTQQVLTILSYLEHRSSSAISTSTSAQKSTGIHSSRSSFDSESQIGFINIDGPLVTKASGISSLCGMTSYRELVDDVRRLAGKAKTIVLTVDSLGGEARQCFESAALIRSIVDKNNCRLLVYIDGNACSAAYALCCAAHEIISNPDSEVGSIGVVAKLRNTSKQLQHAGINDTYISAGAEKVPFTNNGEWRQSFLDEVQAKIDTTYSNFVKHVSDHRGISQQRVIATQAKTFTAKDALSLGLIDHVMTRDEFKDYLQKNKNMKTTTTKPKAKATTTTETDKTQRLTSSEATDQRPERMAPEALPEGFERNPVTGMLQPKGRNSLSQKQRQERLKRIAKLYSPKECLQIIESTQHLSDPEYEERVKFLEAALGRK